MSKIHFKIRRVVSAFLALGAVIAPGMVAAGQAQTFPEGSSPEGSEERVDIPPQVLAEIREAPFSQLFSVADGAAFGVKDKDYNPAEPTIGVFSLWADVPEQDRLEMVMKYCVENTAIARASASLVEVSVLNGDETLVVIDDVVEAGTASIDEVQPPRSSGVGTSFYYDPFYNPYYYSPFSFGITYSPTVQLPAVDCSAGISRFNLMPVRNDLARLPDSTLSMRLLFSDGNTEYWRLGRGTVNALKQMPSVQ